ncbi:hypothetical protein PR202_ga02888 [Eleusine coracana subsp. coracana]|uniref:LysM domain-containing protein n=1 Tax=Eleusine coracana subsp. coracana TaxID=191504 RepID=A0AAV5BNU8_ELECO|nr:hypothetical protein PR202_ga02888 [Eleusine coracana subsp. coracana]
MGLFVRVPARCACAGGVRKSVSVRYAARPADTLADVAFAGLASADQIRDENGLTAADPDARRSTRGGSCLDTGLQPRCPGSPKGEDIFDAFVPKCDPSPDVMWKGEVALLCICSL